MVRLVTAQATAASPGVTTVPTVYRLVQPAAGVGQPATVTTVAANQPAAPQKKSVALMLTVSLGIFFRPRIVPN